VNLPKGQIQKHHQIILDSIADGVFTVDMELCVTSFNRAAEKITRIPRKEAIGRQCFDVLRASVCEQNCLLRETIETARDPLHALGRLLPYLRPFRGMLIAVCGMIVIYTVLGLIGPYLMGVAIDRFIVVKELAGLEKISLWMLVIYLLNNQFQAVSAWLMADVSQRALKQLRRDLFSHMQTLPVSFFDDKPAGELMSRLTNDIDAINQAVSQNLVSIIASLLTLVGILIAMFVLNFWLALASVLVVPIMLWFTGFVAKYTRKGFRSLQKELGGLNAVIEENISGARVVKAFRRSDTAIEAFREHNQAVYKAGLYANTYALLLMPLTKKGSK